MCDIALQELALVEDLERDNKLALLLTRQVNMAKLATTKRLANLEVINAPLSAIECYIGDDDGGRDWVHNSRHRRPTVVVWGECSLIKSWIVLIIKRRTKIH